MGYGVLNICGKIKGAHVFSYELEYGLVEKGNQVLHSCDNPPCCNPKHLFLGNHLINMEDRNNKGRSKGPAGTLHANAILSEKDVVDIRKLYQNENITLAQLSQKFGVTLQSIHYIIKRKTWKHLV